MKHRIEPFDALIYDTARAGALNDLIAPPYDLVDHARQHELYERSPFNIIRLELNASPDPYEDAAGILMRWRRRGVLYQSGRFAFYLYSQKFDHDGRARIRQGIIARVKLEEFASGRILPHERTFPKAKADRLQLLEATRTNLSSIFGLYASMPDQLRDLLAKISEHRPGIAAEDDCGVTHEVRFIETAEAIATIQFALNGQRILIADGHHRYETALEYRRRRASGPSQALRSSDYVMMTLVAFNDPGLVILPTHRIVRRLPEAAMRDFDSLCREAFVTETYADRERFRAALRAGAKGSIGVALRNSSEMRLLRLKNVAAITAALPDTPAVVGELDVSILHALIFGRIFGIQPEDVRRGDNIEYTIDADYALNEVGSGAADGAFLMNPPSVQDVARVSESGATMPEKSTYFFPKLATGLVMNALED